MRPAEDRRRFARIATAGIFFQGGAAAVDTGTIVASLVNGLTGNSTAVGAAAAIARYGWLFPQIVVAYAAQARRRRMPFYALGAFGRVVCLAGVAALVLWAGRAPGAGRDWRLLRALDAYAFVGGILAVPYNDIVARAVPSDRRSRLLAVRFFGGGLLALGVAAAASRLLGATGFPAGHAGVLALGAVLLLVSTLSFLSAGERPAPEPPRPTTFRRFLGAGLDVLREDARFRRFLHVRWLDGVASMALPFYVVAAIGAGIGPAGVAVLLGAQTAGALASNPIWGWWGDRRGKRALVVLTAGLAVLAPLFALVWVGAGATGQEAPLVGFALVFFLLGAVNNGGTIAYLGYLWEISPDARRPAYSGYFNALAAPAALSPLAGAAVVEGVGLPAMFLASALAAVAQFAAARRLGRDPVRGGSA